MDMGESHDEERGMDTGESHDGLPDPGPEWSDEQGSNHLVDWEECARVAAPRPTPTRGAGPRSWGFPGKAGPPSGTALRRAGLRRFFPLGDPDGDLAGGPDPGDPWAAGTPGSSGLGRDLSLGTFADGPRRWGIPGPAGPSQEWIWKVPFSLKHHGFQRKKTWSAVRGTERKGRWVSPTLEAQGFRPRFVPSPGGKPRAVPFPSHGSDGGPTWGNAAYLWPRPGNWPTITFFGAP